MDPPPTLKTWLRPCPRGRTTVFRRANHLSISPSHAGPTQPPTLSRTGNECRPKCGNVLRLGRKSRMAHFVCGYTCGWQVKLCEPSLTRAILSALEMNITHYKVLYKCPVYLLTYLLTGAVVGGVVAQRVRRRTCDKEFDCWPGLGCVMTP